MAAAQFDVPKLKAYPEIPAVQKDAMAGTRPFVASPAIQQALGFPGELVDNWQEKAVDKMAELLGKYRSFKVIWTVACIVAPARINATISWGPGTPRTCRWRGRIWCAKYTGAISLFPENIFRN